MQGLELAKHYFATHGRPLLEERFAPYHDRIAAGLVGDGSECYGYDDEQSRDHDWGPGFYFWLTPADYRAFGRELQQAYDEMPAVFQEYGPRRTSQWGEGRTGVREIGDFYEQFLGRPEPPADPEDWLFLPENALAACTNGAVFTDPLGEFSRRRRALQNFYPEDVRLKKIAARCMTIAQSGQYNFGRCMKRGDLYGARYAETKFCADVYSLVFLLGRRYAPFYKWVSRAAEELPEPGKTIGRHLTNLLQTAGARQRQTIIEGICNLLIKELTARGLSDCSSDFLADHGPAVQQKIADPGLRQRNVWIG